MNMGIYTVVAFFTESSLSDTRHVSQNTQSSLSGSDHDTMICGLAAKHFSLTTLHKWQKDTIAAAISGRDTLVIQPTGSRKSLCFILPPLYSNKTTIVISPTISLMTDQVGKLSRKGISATFLGSAQKEDVMPRVRSGSFHLVYTTPESFFDFSTKQPKQVFLDLASEGKLSLIAVDEAHLVNSWKSFRYTYMYMYVKAPPCTKFILPLITLCIHTL